MNLQHFKLNSGQEIIGEVRKQDRKVIRLRNVYLVVNIRTPDGLMYQSMFPYTTQNFNEELRDLKLYKRNVLATYRPSRKTREEYERVLLDREEDKKKNIFPDSDEELEAFHSQFETPDTLN